MSESDQPWRDDLPWLLRPGAPAPADLPEPPLGADEPPAPTEPPRFEVGVFRDMPFATYRAIEAMSQSGAGKMLKSPAHFKLARDEIRRSTPAKEFGTAVHCGVLEPGSFEERYARGPEERIDKRTKAGKAQQLALEEFARGRDIISFADHERASRCIAAVLEHPAAIRLLDGGERELSLFWNDRQYGVPCKARVDTRNLGGLVDLKTTADASRDAFSRSIATYGYHIQAAHYFSGAEHALDATPEFFAIIAVESEPPHAVACYQIGSASILSGARLMDEALRRYAKALECGRFEGYPPQIETLDAPAWARRFDL